MPSNFDPAGAVRRTRSPGLAPEVAVKLTSSVRRLALAAWLVEVTETLVTEVAEAVEARTRSRTGTLSASAKRRNIVPPSPSPSCLPLQAALRIVPSPSQLYVNRLSRTASSPASRATIQLWTLAGADAGRRRGLLLRASSAQRREIGHDEA